MHVKNFAQIGPVVSASLSFLFKISGLVNVVAVYLILIFLGAGGCGKVRATGLYWETENYANIPGRGVNIE